MSATDDDRVCCIIATVDGNADDEISLRAILR